MNISIVIPHFNSHKGLNRLLKSIPDKSNIEIVVVDDNSKIHPEIEVPFKNAKILIDVNDTGNKGAGAARNKALSIISGEWVLFADADDFFVPGAFDKIESEVNDSYDVVFFKPTSLSLKTNNLAERHIEYESLINAYITSENEDVRYKFYVPWSKIVKRSLIVGNSIVFDEVIASNDVMFSLKLGTFLSSFKVSESTIYCVTSGAEDSSLTKRSDNLVMRSRLEVEIRRNKFCALHKLNRYKNSILFVLIKYRKVIDRNTLRRLFKLFSEKQLTFLPNDILTIIQIKLKKRALVNNNKKDSAVE